MGTGSSRLNKAKKRKYALFYAAYPAEFSVKFRQRIRRRDNYLCAICHKKKRLDVHHIDYKKQNTVAKNCISLCRSCHSEIHRSSDLQKIDWRSKLSRIAAEREMTYDFG